MNDAYIKKKLICCLHGLKGVTLSEVQTLLFDYVYKDCIKTAIGILHSLPDAEDVVLKTLTHILKKPLEDLVFSIYSHPNIKGYFCLSVRRRSFNLQKDNQKRRAVDIVEHIDYAKDSSLMKTMEYLLLEENIYKALSKLSDTERLVFCLKIIDGYTHKEIIEMGIVNSITQSTSTLNRAKRKLQATLVIYAKQ